MYVRADNGTASPPLLDDLSAAMVPDTRSAAARAIVANMAVSRRGLGVAVPQEPADDRQVDAGSSADAGEAVPEVVKAQVGESGMGAPAACRSVGIPLASRLC